MSYRLVLIFCFVVLCLVVNAQVARTEYTYIVRARAVDEHNRPVAHANVTVTLGSGNRGDFTYSYEADGDGRIYFLYEHSTAPNTTRVLYVTDPLPPSTVTMVSPPFKELSNLTALKYVGRPISIKKNGEVDLGDIGVRVHYGVVRVYLRNKAGIPLVAEANKWEYVWLRVQNEMGKVVAERNITRSEIRAAVNMSDSSVRVALPEGKWRIRVSLNEDKAPFLRHGGFLTVRTGMPESAVILKKLK